MKISIVVAAAENDVIGRDNSLIWKLSNDMKHFKALTTGHPVIMGRRTFESIGKPLPARTNIVITKNENYTAKGCIIAHSIDEALKKIGNATEVFIIGGGELYRQLWTMADKLYLTRVHTTVEGDTKIPPVDTSHWIEEDREFFPADEKNQFDHTIISYHAV